MGVALRPTRGESQMCPQENVKDRQAGKLKKI